MAESWRWAPAAVLVLAILACSPRLPSDWKEPQTGMEFILVPAGTFAMGSPTGERGREPQEVLHRVQLTKPFYLGRYEVTQGQWQAVMGGNPSRFRECGSDCPVEDVSWHQAREFLELLGEASGERFRLPTEAEWEYACRAGTSTPFSMGEDLSSDDANYDGDPALAGWPPGLDRGRTTPVGTFAANPWGFHDLHGNVWEWTEDWHCAYPSGPIVDPVGDCEGGLRVIRGGSWHFGPDSARCALRYTHRPGDIGPSLGFRVVREIPTASAFHDRRGVAGSDDAWRGAGGTGPRARSNH